MALALLFFRMEILAIVIPTFSASSVTLIFRFANITSTLIMIAMLVGSHREVVFGFHIQGILPKPLEHRGRRGDDDRQKNQKKAHHNPARNVVFAAYRYKYVGFCRCDKANESQGAVFYRLQSFHGLL